MSEPSNGYEKLVEAFHQTWDGFPGASRLIDKTNKTIAVNRFAKGHGLEVGQICARIGTPESHRGCLKNAALKSKSAQVDRPEAGKIRGWLPVENYPDLVVHFSPVLPECNSEKQLSGGQNDERNIVRLENQKKLPQI